MAYQSLVIKNKKYKSLGGKQMDWSAKYMSQKPKTKFRFPQSGNGSTLATPALWKQRQEDP